MWSTIANYLFPPVDGYTTAVRDRTRQHVNKQPDVMVKQIQNGTPHLIFMMENERYDLTTSDTAWKDATIELFDYLQIAAMTAPGKLQFGLVAIGRHVRFYQRLPPGNLVDLPGTSGKPYEVSRDRDQIQSILLRIKEATKKK
ncbi:MAG: hypothetical protein M1830_003938 [Pleopsidium flavum]|nr:MAG: hypothetical protein M1830_003938 [Pleopsidium flavum]